MAINEQFTEELRELINKHSVDSEANIPDFILAESLTEMIQSMADMNNKRERWFGRDPLMAPIELKPDGEQV